MNKSIKLMSILLAMALVLSAGLPILAQAEEKAEEVKVEETDDHVYKVEYMVKRGWLVGRENKDLDLEAPITRAEFVKMIVESHHFGRDALAVAGQEDLYTDVPKDHWANGYIHIATRDDYVVGYDDGQFKPDETITYYEILTVLSRLDPRFHDLKVQGEGWANPYVDFARENGYLEDVNILYGDLSQDALREQAFNIVYNYYIKVYEKPVGFGPKAD